MRVAAEPVYKSPRRSSVGGCPLPAELPGGADGEARCGARAAEPTAESTADPTDENGGPYAPSRPPCRRSRAAGADRAADRRGRAHFVDADGQRLRRPLQADERADGVPTPRTSTTPLRGLPGAATREGRVVEDLVRADDGADLITYAQECRLPHHHRSPSPEPSPVPTRAFDELSVCLRRPDAVADRRDADADAVGSVELAARARVARRRLFLYK